MPTSKSSGFFIAAREFRGRGHARRGLLLWSSLALAACSTGAPPLEDDSAIPDVGEPVIPVTGGIPDALPGPQEPDTRDDKNSRSEPSVRGDSGAPGKSGPTPVEPTSGSMPGSTTKSPSDAAPSLLEPRLLGSTYEGQLCPSGSLTVREPAPGRALTIELGADLHSSERAVEASCQVKLKLRLPDGHSVDRAYVQALGHSWSSDGAADLKVVYGYASSAAKGELSKSFSGAQEAFAVREVMQGVTSPCSSSSGATTELVLDITAAARGETHFQLATIQVGLSHVDGAQWKRCADSKVVTPAASVAGAPCGGPARHACASGLECDLADAPHGEDALLTGTCVKPAERLPAQGKDGPCNGLRDIACQSGLSCHYQSAARAARDLIGVCAPMSAKPGELCDGSPAIACATGSFCGARGRCRTGDGSRGSACELGGSECDGDLTCISGKCAEEGDTIDRPTVTPLPTPTSPTKPPVVTPAPTKPVQPTPTVITPTPTTPVEPEPPVVTPAPTKPVEPTPPVVTPAPTKPVEPTPACDPEVAGCLEPAGTKVTGDRCLDVSECASGLRCQSHFCRADNDGWQWSACTMDSQCRGYLKCDPERLICLPYADGTEGSDCGSPGDCNADLTCENYKCLPSAP